MSYLSALLLNKCPRCRQGDLFKNKNPYVLKKVFDMHDHCPECGQKVELEIGFWYGTGYVSYVVAVLFSLFNLAWYWIFIGISWKDDSVFHWLIVNGILLGLIMPGLIRWSRTLYLSFFVSYEPGADQKH